MPKRRTWMPPALVERLPPIWQLPSAPRLSGKKRSAASAAFWMFCRMQPASTVIVKSSASRLRTAFMRSSDSRMQRASSGRGTEPPTRPVLPPCGTTAMPASEQIRMQAETSAVDAGRATSSAGPR